MDAKWLWTAFLMALAMAVSARAAPLPSCNDESVDDLTFLDDEDVASHRMFELAPVVFADGDNASYQVSVHLIVNADGTVRCADMAEDDVDSLPPLAVHYPEPAVRAEVAKWRYEPYRDGGKPVPFSVDETLLATHAPLKPAAMPAATPATTTLSLQRSHCLGDVCPAYKLTIHGDGRVEFDGLATDVTGHLAYEVAPSDVDALVADLRRQNLWSVQDAYVSAATDSANILLTLDLGGQHKTIRDYVGQDAGMPDTVTSAEAAMDSLAGVDRWIHVSQDSLSDLDALHFDYTGQAGANLLVNVIEDSDAEDAVALALLDRHASLAGKTSTYPDGDAPDETKWPVDAAFEGGRTALVGPLIGAGALLKEGKPEQVRINSAFRTAIEAGDLEDAKKIGTFHPAVTYGVTYTDYDTDPSTDKTLAVPLLFDVQAGSDTALETVRYLVSLGADPKGKNEDGATTLEKLCDNAEIVKYLIGMGVDINAKDNDGNTALLEVDDEDAAVFLLDSGADATVQNGFGDTIFSQADFHAWPKVQAWLKAHKVKKPEPAPEA